MIITIVIATHDGRSGCGNLRPEEENENAEAEKDGREDPEQPELDVTGDPDLCVGVSGEVIRVLKRPDYDMIRKDLENLWNEGYQNVAIALMHSYTYPEHEITISKLAKDIGFEVAVSSELQPMIRIVSRAQSAAADAYLSPVIHEYLVSFAQGFDGAFQNARDVNMEDHGETYVDLGEDSSRLTASLVE